MKGLFVFLVIAAIANAATVPKAEEQNIIEDILAVRQCLENLFAKVDEQVAAILGSVAELQSILNNTLASLNTCISLEDPLAIFNCINGVANDFVEELNGAILNIQMAVSGLLSLPDDIVECFAILN